jgi:hypothetical protein
MDHNGKGSGVHYVQGDMNVLDVKIMSCHGEEKGFSTVTTTTTTTTKMNNIRKETTCK